MQESDAIAQIHGIVDPRTGDYVQVTEANKDEAAELLGFVMAWRYYWDGPLVGVTQPLYDREAWINCAARCAWLDDLTDEQRKMLEDSFPPEEVPSLEAKSE